MEQTPFQLGVIRKRSLTMRRARLHGIHLDPQRQNALSRFFLDSTRFRGSGFGRPPTRALSVAPDARLSREGVFGRRPPRLLSKLWPDDRRRRAGNGQPACTLDRLAAWDS